MGASVGCPGEGCLGGNKAGGDSNPWPREGFSVQGWGTRQPYRPGHVLCFSRGSERGAPPRRGSVPT